MTRTAYSKPPGDQFQQSTFRTEKSVSGLPSGSDREKEQALPEGAATPNSVSKDGDPADKGQGAGQRALPYGTYNGPASGSGTVDKARTRGVPGEQYGHPSKDDYGYLTRRTMTGADDGVESDIVAYKPRKRGPGSYKPHPFGWRRHRQKPQQRNQRRKRYRIRRSRELQQARRRYRTRYRLSARFKQRRKLCRRFPNRCKMRPTPRRVATTGLPDDIPFLYGCDLHEGFVVDVTDEGLLVLELEDGTEATVSATAFVSTAVFLDDSDIDAVDYLVESSDADEPYGDPTDADVSAVAALHGVPVPADGTPDEKLDTIFEVVMSACESDGVSRTAHDTILYDKTPASELSNNWMNRREPTREVADTRPYKENAPGQWTRSRKDQTHTPSDGGYQDPNPGYYQGGSGKVIPDDMRLAAAWGRVARFDLAVGSPLVGVAVDFQATRFPEPIAADEFGGFRVPVPRFDLDGRLVRDPGVAVFMPQHWPFTDVVEAEATDVRLDDAVGLRFVRGGMVITGMARYDVMGDDGSTDSRTLRIRGVMQPTPTFERRLEVMQAPPPPTPTVAPGSDTQDDRIPVLVALFDRVGDWGKPLVADAIAALREGRPLDAETLKGLRHRFYKSGMADGADMFRTASRTAGVFQAPPALVSTIERWAVRLYAGHVLAWAQSALAAMQGDPAADARAEIARVRASIHADVAALTSPGDTLVIPLPKMTPGGSRSAYYVGVRLVEPDVYLLDVGGNRPTFRSREVVAFPKSMSSVIRDITAPTKYSILGQLDALVDKYGGPVDPQGLERNLVDIRGIVSEARRYADIPATVKSSKKTTVPIDAAALAGWRYADRIPADADARLSAAGMGSITVELNFKSRQTIGGQWDRTTATLEVDTPTYSGLPYPTDVAAFRDGIDRMRKTIRHECQHVGQDVLRILVGLPEVAGVPPRDIRDPAYNPSGTSTRTPNAPRQRHELRDIEFFTRIQDEVDEFVRVSRRIPPVARRRAMEVWTGVDRGVVRRSEFGIPVVVRDFFRELRLEQSGKWRRAVAEFVAGVEAAGVRIPSTGPVLP